MWDRFLEDLNPYEAIKANIEKGVYNEENLNFWKKVFLAKKLIHL